jgi:ribosome-associated toxin RatA of RatAB toxin-antitoxin module
MTVIHRQLIVPYKAKQMYDLVNDITSYPEFLPWCNAAKIIEKTLEQITAEVQLSYVNQSFTTRNTLLKSAGHYKILMNLVDGPFKYLTGEWEFVDLSDQRFCSVNFKLDFEFNNFFLALTFSKVFEQIAHQLVDSFHRRAAIVYGE